MQVEMACLNSEKVAVYRQYKHFFFTYFQNRSMERRVSA